MVIGGGVVGLFTARSLLARGESVVVLDAGVPGEGATNNSAGWIAPALSSPLAGPGVRGKALRWMLQRDSPLLIQPRLDLRWALWLSAFWHHCSWPRFRHGQTAMRMLTEGTMRLFDELEAEDQGFEVHRRGVLMLYLSQRDLEHEAKELQPLCPELEVLGGEKLRQLEPALSNRVVGGFHLPDERHVEPGSLTAALCRSLRRNGVELLSATPVVGFNASAREVTSVSTTMKAIPCSAVVIAAGAWTDRLSSELGVRLPIEAGKGYRLDYRPSPIQLNYPLHLNEGKVAVSPFEGSVRLAGTMEFSGINARVVKERVVAIARSMSLYVEDWPLALERTEVGIGLRPMTPDGLPVIGRLPGWRNVFVASGHGMLGVHLAPGTGEALAELMATQKPSTILEPFTAARFRQRASARDQGW